MTASHPVFQRLHELSRPGPIVVAHRGNSSEFAENTLPAFLSARDLGVAMQEFDIRATRDGRLVCIHDETVDRTTDAITRLGPGALVAQLTGHELARLDASPGHATPGAHIPPLDEVLTAIEPAIPMIEHKAGKAPDYVAELRRLGRSDRILLQSFDWDFVAAVGAAAAEIALALLGPRHADERLDATAIAQAKAAGAGLLHWCADEVTVDAARAAHAAGLLLCTYTTDDAATAIGLARSGVDAFCTNRPAAMLAMQRNGLLARS